MYVTGKSIVFALYSEVIAYLCHFSFFNVTGDSIRKLNMITVNIRN